MAIEETTIEAGGLSWEAGTAGDRSRDPVLLLHGFPEHWRTWDKIMPAVAARGFRVHAVCLPGYGATGPPVSYEIDRVAAHVADLCRAIGGERGCHVVGHDWGGIVASALASSDPGAVRSVVLACCAHPAAFSSALADPRQMLRSWYVGMFQIPGIERVLTPWIGSDRPSSWVSAIEDRSDLRRALGYYRANLRPWHLTGSAAGRISLPTLVVHAARDVALTERIMRRTAEMSDDLRGFTVLECGHFVHRECPEAFLDVVIPFLESSPTWRR